MVLWSVSLHAADVSGDRDGHLTETEMQAGVEMLPSELHDVVRKSAQSASNLLTDLEVRRAIADQVRAEAGDQKADVVARLRLVQDKVLYDVFVENLLASKINDETVLKLAREEYRAFPERYRVDAEIRARHILIPACHCAPDGAVRERAENILQRLKAGESFEEIARAESADKGSAENGGDLGFFSRGKMVQPFEEAAFALQTPGELSGIVETQFGYHIIRLEEQRGGRVRTFDEVKEELAAQVRKNLQAKIHADMLGPVRDRIRENLDLETFRRAIDGSF